MRLACRAQPLASSVGLMLGQVPSGVLSKVDEIDGLDLATP